MLTLPQAAIVLTDHHDRQGAGEKEVTDDVLAQSPRLRLPLPCCRKRRSKRVREANKSILPMGA
jgi:hypothetical protein